MGAPDGGAAGPVMREDWAEAHLNFFDGGIVAEKGGELKIRRYNPLHSVHKIFRIRKFSGKNSCGQLSAFQIILKAALGKESLPSGKLLGKTAGIKRI